MRLKRAARKLNYEWLDAIDAINMLDACELIIHSSLARTESRGPFMRRPTTSNGLPPTQMRVLDALDWIAENALPDLAYRWHCGSKMCGTCAVRMNGREVLACWEAAEADMLIEPLRNMPVLRDFVVDRAPFERKLASFEPWLDRATPYSGFPEPLSHKDMENASKALDCIACLACDSACPVIEQRDSFSFPGPATLVQLAQTALDPRNDPNKVARALSKAAISNCVSCYQCEEVCPAHIPIVSAVIEPLQAKAAALVPGAVGPNR